MWHDVFPKQQCRCFGFNSLVIFAPNSRRVLWHVGCCKGFLSIFQDALTLVSGSLPLWHSSPFPHHCFYRRKCHRCFVADISYRRSRMWLIALHLVLVPENCPVIQAVQAFCTVWVFNGFQLANFIVFYHSGQGTSILGSQPLQAVCQVHMLAVDFSEAWAFSSMSSKLPKSNITRKTNLPQTEDLKRNWPWSAIEWKFGSNDPMALILQCFWRF